MNTNDKVKELFELANDMWLFIEAMWLADESDIDPQVEMDLLGNRWNGLREHFHRELDKNETYLYESDKPAADDEQDER